MKTISQGEFQVHLKRLSKAWLAGVLLLATPVFAGTILPGNGSGSPGRTDWNIPAHRRQRSTRAMFRLAGVWASPHLL